MKVYLIQARNPDDIAQGEEVECFALQTGLSISQIHSINIATDQFAMKQVADADAVLVGGAGEFSVLDDDTRIKNFIDVLGELTTTEIPLFASCFGFQALVLALGGSVIKDVPNAEVGTYELYKTESGETDPLFHDIPQTFTAQLGHQDRASKISDELINLAYSERAPYQAFRYKDKAIYAAQFHPELRDVDNAKRFARYMSIYGKLFGEKEAQERMDSHRPSPHANTLLSRFFATFVSVNES